MPQVPKRSEQRRRRNKPEGVQAVRATAGPSITWPEPSVDWQAAARDWYLSLRASGQAQFYEQSDVALAFYVAELMSRSLQAEKVNGQLVAVVLSAQADLLTTEGGRRRARIELERTRAEDDPEELAAVADFSAYQTKLGG